MVGLSLTLASHDMSERMWSLDEIVAWNDRLQQNDQPGW